MKPIEDTSFWILERDEPLAVLAAICDDAPLGATVVFEGKNAREALLPGLAPFSTDSGYAVFRDSSSEGTELFEISISEEAIRSAVAYLKDRPVWEFFYHFKVVESGGRIWAWHHDASQGGYPYFSPLIDERIIETLARKLECKYALQKDGMWDWSFSLQKRANQSPEPTVMSVTPPAAQEPRQP